MKKLVITLISVIALGHSSYAQWTTTGTNIYNTNTGNVGIANSAPLYKLDILGTSAAYTGGTAGIFSLSTGTGASTDERLQVGIVDGSSGYSWLQAIKAGTTLRNLVLQPGGGNVGIGTTTPPQPLTIQNDAADLRLQAKTNTAYYTDIVQNYNALYPFYINTNQEGRIGFKEFGLASPDGGTAFISGYYGIAFATSATDPTSVNIKMAILQNGNVLIGKTTQLNSTYKLDVAGNVRSNQVVVNVTGADFVFDPRYQLSPLSELRKYIAYNRHLPEIPSAQQMQAEGLNVGENQIKLLQKVEELTLYLIDKDKQLTDQAQKIQKQEIVAQDQEKRIRALEEELIKLTQLGVKTKK